ncbi:hypothetical protein ACVXG9_09865 [Escherichia coli]
MIRWAVPVSNTGSVLAKYYNLNLTIVNDQVDQTFRFMHLDKDGAIRMDCSSECAMAGLLALRDKFDSWRLLTPGL